MIFMSTRFTQKGTPMVDSHALQLVLSAAKVNELATEYLSDKLNQMGYKAVSPSLLKFLSALDCGVNFSSEIARNLDVSRQMVAKTVKVLCKAGYLEQVDDVGKQKRILFTDTGELLMSDARRLLAEFDNKLIEQCGKKIIKATLTSLEEIQRIMAEINDT